MADQKAASRPVTQWRCLIEGCRIEGKWQPVLPGEEFYPPEHPRSHYRQEHYPQSEQAYHARLAEQREARKAHYRLTGEILPPQF
jgi:hypothetical protein